MSDYGSADEIKRKIQEGVYSTVVKDHKMQKRMNCAKM